MPSIKDLWPDRWLRAEHLADRRARVAIETVTVETLYNPRSRRPEPRLVITFHKKSLRLVCNKTQALALADITGETDYTRWIGHEIVLSRGTAPNGMDTITISPIPDPQPAARPATAAQQEEDEEDIDPDTGFDDNPFDH